jgi:hypothetical protein
VRSACPQDPEHDDTPLLFKYQVDRQAFPVMAEMMRPHLAVRVAALEGIAAPGRQLQPATSSA